MSSTNVVNYSLRQNKSIERSIVFDGARAIVDCLDLHDLVYVGFGSVWFSDFHLAHRNLDIQTMVSVEADAITYARAQFNRPYRTVEVVEGEAATVLPQLLQRNDLQNRPWMVWLDYDRALDEGKLDELEELLIDLPPNSFLITTFSAAAGQYGRPASREQRLGELFGDAAPAGLDVDEYKDNSLAPILAQCVQDVLLAKSLASARPGAYVPAFRLAYRDATPMATAGGFLPSPDLHDEVEAITHDAHWAGMVADTINTTPLTAKESLALQQALPVANAPLTRSDVQTMGFDLEEGQIASFQRHYLRYPSFAQLAK